MIYKCMNLLMNFINKDVKNENETKKTAVALRLVSLTMIIYLTALLGLFFKSREIIVIVLLCIIIYGICFALTYQNKTFYSLCIINIHTLVWVIVFVLLLGWNTGVQHFLFAGTVLYLFTSYDNKIYRLWYVFLLILIRISLYYYSGYYEPVYVIHKNIEDLFQILNTFFIFFIITEICIVYHAKNLEIEKKLMQYNKKLEKQAATDPLTGLANRRRARDYLMDTVKKYGTENMNFSIAICDVDNFKSINDKYGHDCGDYVLKKVAQIMKSFMERVGYAARWGGEEFLLTFNNCNIDEANQHLYDLMILIRNTGFIYNEQVLKITLTYGLEEYNNNCGIEETIKVADEKMYTGKRMGKNRIIF